jgi:hypothetical protein
MARTPTIDPALLSLHLQASGPLSAQALAGAVGVDRVTVQRALRRLAPAVVQLGSTRGTRYALRRAVFGQTDRQRFSCLSQTGIAHEWGRLSALHGGWHLEWAAPSMRPDWADRVHDHTGFCDGLPFFLADLRPQGFLGRAIARRLPGTIGLPQDPRDWNNDQTLFYLREWGDDLPGNLALGEGPTQRALDAIPADPVTPETRAERYAELANRANAGEPTGSSVEGEQPKFSAWVRQAGDAHAFSVLVKFTDQLETPTGRRWADLLAAEAIALDVLTWASRGDAEAHHPNTFDLAGRRFYELPRFDRIGAHGRRGVVSLRALHDAGFTGADTNEWAVAAAGLHAGGWLNDADLRAVRLRQLFGRLIGNTDMHFGNLAFFLEMTLPLKLAPTYDMLPMLWAPRPGDATPAPDFSPSAPLPHELKAWPEAAKMAEEFWRRVEADARVSDGFRPHAAAALRAVRQLRSRFG